MVLEVSIVELRWVGLEPRTGVMGWEWVTSAIVGGPARRGMTGRGPTELMILVYCVSSAYPGDLPPSGL
jgi:hypothetical protein